MSAALGFWVSKLIVKGFGSVKASHLTLWSKSAVTFTAELQPNYTTAIVSSSYPLKIFRMLCLPNSRIYSMYQSVLMGLRMGCADMSS